MQNKYFNGINVSTRILITLLLILSIFIANSLYLIIFLTILIIILLILTNKSVKRYVDFIKKIKFWLLFIIVTYIIISRNIYLTLLLSYKIILVALIIENLSLTTDFESLNNGIKTLFKPFKNKKIDLNNISYEITLIIYFIKFYLNTNSKINKFYKEKYTLKKISLKSNIFPRVFMTMSEMEKLENSIKLKLYKPKFEKKNIKSSIFLLIFLTLFVMVIFKEVIL